MHNISTKSLPFHASNCSNLIFKVGSGKAKLKCPMHMSVTIWDLTLYKEWSLTKYRASSSKITQFNTFLRFCEIQKNRPPSAAPEIQQNRITKSKKSMQFYRFWTQNSQKNRRRNPRMIQKINPKKVGAFGAKIHFLDLKPLKNTDAQPIARHRKPRMPYSLVLPYSCSTI